MAFSLHCGGAEHRRWGYLSHQMPYVICAMKRAAPFEIQFVVLDGGERLSMLIDEAGMPLYFPTLFITTQIRNAGRSANTISAYLSAIRRLYIWARASQIDIEQRISRRCFLTDSEVESLCASIGRRVHRSSSVPKGFSIRQGAKRDLVAKKDQVLNGGKYRNLTYIVIYLRWFAARLTERACSRVDAQARSDISAMGEAIEARRPRRVRRAILNARQGLTHEDENRLLKCLSEQHLENATSPQACRDELIVHLLLKLGIRAGELLSLKVGDFNLRTNEVLIARRPDTWRHLLLLGRLLRWSLLGGPRCCFLYGCSFGRSARDQEALCRYTLFLQGLVEPHRVLAAARPRLGRILRVAVLGGYGCLRPLCALATSGRIDVRPPNSYERHRHEFDVRDALGRAESCLRGG